MSSWNRFRNNVKSTVSCGRVFSTVLALVLIFTMVLSGAILVACNPKGNGDAAEKERAAACDALRANALAAVNDAWTDGLSDEQIVLLPDAGKYVLAVNWTGSLADFLKNSALQTEKIKRLADFLATDEGKQTVRNVSGNIDGLINVFNSVGFTSADAQSLVYDGLLFLVGSAQSVFEATQNKLSALLPAATGDAYDDISAQLDSTRQMLAVYDDNPEAVDNAAAELAKAEQGIKSLTDFAYRTAWTFGGGDSGESLGGLAELFSSGSLSGVSDREAFVYIDSVMNSLRELRATLTDEQIAALSSAFDSLENLLETAVLPVELFENTEGNTTRLDTILENLYGLRFSVDWLQSGTDWLIDALDMIYETDETGAYTYRFVRRITEAFADKEYVEENSLILICEVMYNALQKIPASEIKAKINAYSDETDLNKLAVILMTSGYLRALEISGSAEPDPTLNDELTFAMRVYALKAFKASYRTYLATGDRQGSGITKNNTRILVEYIGKQDQGLTQYGDGHGEITQTWYDGIVAEATAKLTADAQSMKNDAIGNICAQIDKWYTDTDGLAAFAARTFVNADTTEEELKDLTAAAEKLPVWVQFVIRAIFGGK